MKFNLTDNDKRVLKALATQGLFQGKEVRRSNILSRVNLDPSSIHYSLVSMALAGLLVIRSTKGLGNPTYITTTKKGEAIWLLHQ